MAKTNATLDDFDWNELSSLRLRARAIADGLYVGIHRSARRGVGVEFGGRRNYVPGDDLRWLDRHALMRHGRLLVREFETETDRLFYLVVDATASMNYKSEIAAVSKWSYAATIASALARLALSSGDPVALDWIGGRNNRWLPKMSGKEAFDRVVAALEAARPGGPGLLEPAEFERCLVPVGRYARAGTIVVAISDLIDLPEGSIERLSELAGSKRSLVVLRLLDPAEVEFPFSGAMRFVPLEGTHTVETDANSARKAYHERLLASTARAKEIIEGRGGRLLFADTRESPVETVRRVVESIGSVRS
jgi:uncharacterized protein (DUF58 family)